MLFGLAVRTLPVSGSGRWGSEGLGAGSGSSRGQMVVEGEGRDGGWGWGGPFTYSTDLRKLPAWGSEAVCS